MRVWITASAAETRAVGTELARELRPARCLLLYGDLGAGKTVLAQGVALGLGLDPNEVQSPTFALLRELELPESAGTEGRLAHLDLYRLLPEEAAACGFEEVLLGPGVKIVEWAERLPFSVPGALALTLREKSDGRREIAELEHPPELAGN
ncbi:MAG: tRNA (adenosine(37)-N6)-threonylcarbamoyltransferase complex ATPase subunit type 1 TsaE [Thermoanaerobaculia bacterium]